MAFQAAQLLPRVVDIAREAGRCILAVYGEDNPVERKADNSPLTVADRAAHEAIVAGLGALTPDIPVWSEESATVPWEMRRHWPSFWLVDPLDGTREFLHRNGEFTVNIALIEDHHPVLGVVHVPVTGRDYWGGPGGAFRHDPGQPPVPIHTRQPATSPVRVVGSRSHRGTSLDGFLARLGPHELVTVGSSLKFCLVAEGTADIYPRLGPTSEWDSAAAHAVVEAAGGQVLDLEGRPLRYNRGPDRLNPHFIAIGDGGRDWLALLAG